MSNITMQDNVPTLCSTDVKAIFSPSALSLYLTHASLACIMAVITITSNCTFLATMFQMRGQRSISNKLLMTLSTIDLLIGVLAWPLIAALTFQHYKIDVDCYLLEATLSSGYHFAMVTLCTIFLVAFEQYLAILHPYFYISQVTYSRLIWPLIASNSALLLISIIVQSSFRKIWIYFIQILFLPISVVIVVGLVYMYQKIIVCASRVAVRINSTNKEEGRQIKSRVKAAKSSLIILIATLVCYSPVISYNIYKKLENLTPYNMTFFGYSSQIMAMITSVIDPVVYYWRLRSLRKATKDMFSSIFKSNNQVRSLPMHTNDNVN